MSATMTNPILQTHLTAPSKHRDDAVYYIINMFNHLSPGKVQTIVARIREFGGSDIVLTTLTTNGSEMMQLPPALHAQVIALLPEMAEWHFANIDQLERPPTGEPLEWDLDACYADLEAKGLLNDLFSQPYVQGFLR
ncbi:hypothetical protein CcaverHIS002_0605020 [Cutaneotrichosporon cavernicola]|uniref:Uncharacterized protein n=1 Tax=Cutaneotrichosporon cavernicola TaxID=279322 RepID=A0AA48L8M9_9TREE|nr:uncharacterized protein CcaverHIS019_0604460 [Cutaneotrichosporon cavernicola]BEI86215.1 hypothetical protein CcaverHIS002_0605020 [Cutaneotrichosporon cavernicola]BEI93987.1 hypothetical protein CcaverHIS019_0604460 [Cutaneotrichosporon cavernicola]BEJ01768.1 hypothetical protein CcaverHIS631_0604500 [Cutaneotrichosporon cavernicola]BEJ09535.1 hypothetical protein CcaverHIS641_0604500 [Cutaneotrichosporon cavernicola]